MKKVFAWVSVYAVFLLFSPAEAKQEKRIVTLDRAEIVNVREAVAALVIGNPAIADASLENTRTLVITGRRYGATNMIALNAKGAIIADYLIAVTAADAPLVRVFRGTARTSLSCTPLCEPAFMPGDAPEFFNTVGQQASAHNGAAGSLSPTSAD